VVKLIKGDKSFAVLMPISVTSEIARLENVDGNESIIIVDESEEDFPVHTVIMDSFPVTRSSSRLNPSVSETQVIRNETSATHADWVSIQTPAAEAIVSGDRHSEEHGISSVAPVHENGTIKWSNVPRQPIPKLDDVNLWIGHQLNYERMPTKYQHMAPEGELIASLDGHPEGLLAIPGDNNGPSRIIVPINQIKSLVLQCHDDIHHQSQVKFLYILKPLYYWPGMTKT
jgi:hypothetical protein